MKQMHNGVEARDIASIRRGTDKRGGIVVYNYDTDTATRDSEVIKTPGQLETAEEKRRRIERETMFGYD